MKKRIIESNWSAEFKQQIATMTDQEYDAWEKQWLKDLSLESKDNKQKTPEEQNKEMDSILKNIM